MSSLELHFLDARGALAPHRRWLAGRLAEAHGRAQPLLRLGPVDVAVKAGRYVIPEKGHVGHSLGPGVVMITVDPENPALTANADFALERMMVHELHHAARWDGPPQRATLGGALVSEGLAGHFAQEVYGGPSEPWESLSPETVRAHAAEAAGKWEASDYNHDAWFYGGGALPRWIGYSLGFRIVARFLSANPDRKPSGLAHADPAAFRPFLETV